jgi:glutamate---cysteine ligase / carboxylate-amine ligase
LEAICASQQRFAIAVTADKLGEKSYLKLLEKRLIQGSSYIRQRRVFQETGSLKAVTALLVREMEEDLVQLSFLPKNREYLQLHTKSK